MLVSKLKMFIAKFLGDDLYYTYKIVKEVRSLPFNKEIASVQRITEELIILLAKEAKRVTNCNNLCMAGGVALNCVANGKLWKAGLFDNIWIQPAAGDAGGALGCALYATYADSDIERIVSKTDIQKGSYLDPEFTTEEIKDFLR